MPSIIDPVRWAFDAASRVPGLDALSGRLERLLEDLGPGEPTVPPAPDPVPPAPGTSLADALDSAARAGSNTVEGLARGAIRQGRPLGDVLGWAEARPGNPGETEGAAVSGAARELGYTPLFAWAADDPGHPAVVTVPSPPPVPDGLFAVPRRVAVLAEGIRRKLVADHPPVGSVLSEAVAFGERDLFRPEVVPALARETALLVSMQELSDDHYEKVVLPLSRVPAVNVIVLAALLLDELLDPMEVLDWIGEDISNLTRRGMPNRPEGLLPLPAPTPAQGGDAAVCYMIFSDTHRDAPQDVEFRVEHFSRNRQLYLRALDWCIERGYTVLENGDCEELWYVPSFDPAKRQTKRDRLTEIVTKHKPVYDKLAALAKQGRHERSVGNHDSYLWEDPDTRAWSAANLPTLRGGFIVPNCKPMDDLLPHVGLNPNDYTSRQAMLVIHGHQFDFWNCDEHNRLGKFITNAAGVPADAFDDIVYDYRGVDRLGHPLIELWDVLGPLTPWSNWPAEDLARQWAEALEQRPLLANVTQDSITFSETFAAALGLLMRSGDLSPFNFHVILCIGHTHNPQSRPWVPYLEGFNPWRNTEVLGERVFEHAFALKTRYLNSGTVGWWEGVIWAIEITEEGQPRLVYWGGEDNEPVPMDWELNYPTPIPGWPWDELSLWARRWLEQDVSAALDALGTQAAPEAPLGAPAAIVRDVVESGLQPDVRTLGQLLSLAAGGVAGGAPNGPLGPAVLPVAATGDRLGLGSTVLAARRSPSLRGGDPRDWPEATRQAGTGVPPIPRSASLAQTLWPLLAAGRSDGGGGLDVPALLRALFFAFGPRDGARP